MPDQPEVTDAQIAEWQALADAATPGPWSADGSHLYGADRHLVAQFHNTGPNEHYTPLVKNRDFALIARTAVPSLIKALTEARRERDEAKGRAETAEMYLAELSPRYAEVVAGRSEARAELATLRESSRLAQVRPHPLARSEAAQPAESSGDNLSTSEATPAP